MTKNTLTSALEAVDKLILGLQGSPVNSRRMGRSEGPQSSHHKRMTNRKRRIHRYIPKNNELKERLETSDFEGNVETKSKHSEESSLRTVFILNDGVSATKKTTDRSARDHNKSEVESFTEKIVTGMYPFEVEDSQMYHNSNNYRETADPELPRDEFTSKIKEPELLNKRNDVISKSFKRESLCDTVFIKMNTSCATNYVNQYNQSPAIHSRAAVFSPLLNSANNESFDKRVGENISNRFEHFDSGMIFLCNYQTEGECFEKMLFGSPEKQFVDISRIRVHTALFLYKVHRHHPVMHGVFAPVAKPEMNIDATAWNGRFPAQVRIKNFYRFKDTLPVAILRSIFNEKKSCCLLSRSDTLDIIKQYCYYNNFRSTERSMENRQVLRSSSLRRIVVHRESCYKNRGFVVPRRSEAFISTIPISSSNSTPSTEQTSPADQLMDSEDRHLRRSLSLEHGKTGSEDQTDVRMSSSPATDPDPLDWSGRSDVVSSEVSEKDNSSELYQKNDFHNSRWFGGTPPESSDDE